MLATLWQHTYCFIGFIDYLNCDIKLNPVDISKVIFLLSIKLSLLEMPGAYFGPCK